MLLFAALASIPVRAVVSGQDFPGLVLSVVLAVLPLLWLFGIYFGEEQQLVSLPTMDIPRTGTSEHHREPETEKEKEKEPETKTGNTHREKDKSCDEFSENQGKLEETPPIVDHSSSPSNHTSVVKDTSTTPATPALSTLLHMYSPHASVCALLLFSLLDSYYALSLTANLVWACVVTLLLRTELGMVYTCILCVSECMYIFVQDPTIIFV